MLGWFVSHRPPGALDMAAHEVFYGRALSVAAFFTQSGRFPAYAVLCAVSLAFGIVRRSWFWRALIAVVTLVGAWIVSDLYKDHFMRARPPAQLVFHEPSFSYASGHATLALTFYGAWALYAWRSDLELPVRRALVAFVALVVLAIGLSRLALGAHYLTDVIGGYLLGATFLCILAAATRSLAPEKQNPFGR